MSVFSNNILTIKGNQKAINKLVDSKTLNKLSYGNEVFQNGNVFTFESRNNFIENEVKDLLDKYSELTFELKVNWESGDINAYPELVTI
jgi:hypothetical protein